MHTPGVANDSTTSATYDAREPSARLAVRASKSWARHSWWKVLLSGFALYVAAMQLLASSGNPNVVPTVLLLGAFLVPVSSVVFLSERGALARASPSVLALTFFLGGVVGTGAAQLLEEQLVGGLGLLSMLAVGFSEEIAKLIAIAWLFWRREPGSTLHGILYGMAAGMGFAAFESMGYGFTFLLQSR